MPPGLARCRASLGSYRRDVRTAWRPAGSGRLRNSVVEEWLSCGPETRSAESSQVKPTAAPVRDSLLKPSAQPTLVRTQHDSECLST